MKTVKSKILFAIIISLFMALVFAVISFAANAESGYCVNDEGKETNIKWEMTSDGILSFTIDASATDKVQTTELFNRDPKTSDEGTYNKNLPTFADAVKVVIGDGITAVAGFSYNRNLREVELAPSVAVIKNSAFQSDSSISSIYVRGSEAVAGYFDLSNISAMYNYAFDGCKLMTKVKLSDKYNTEIPLECFKATTLKECEIPSSVTVIGDKTFRRVKTLEVLTVLGMETTLHSDGVFTDLTSFPAIKAKAGSKAAEFAIANGYTFIDIDTGTTTQGTKATTGVSGGSTSGGTSTAPSVSDFNHDGATLWGHSTRTYNGSNNVDTWWAYYDDTKTLEFVCAKSSGYCETGTLSDVDDEYTDWAQYKDVIEHIIIDDKIKKISGKAFQNYPALKDVRLGKIINQIDAGAFFGCTSLNTIWKNGEERIEGRADLAQLIKLNDIIKGTSISEIVLNESVTELKITLPAVLKNVYAHNATEALIELAKENLFNLYSLTNPSEKYEYWIYVDPNLPACGDRCVFDFDETTSTLTVYGGGMIGDIVNYYGGGSKNQPWFDIRHQVKHIVISDGITGIGKYAFCELSNLETVQIPHTEEFKILNAAFEKCYNLKSIYRKGTEPIEGTLDLSNVPELCPWTFAYDYLIANVIIGANVKKVGSSTFEENIALNLASIYGVPGSYAETYASENGLSFYDISSNTPSAIVCTPPEPQESAKDTTDTTSAQTEETKDPETDPDPSLPVIVYEDEIIEEDGISILPVVISVVVVIVAIIVVVLLKKFKGTKAK